MTTILDIATEDGHKLAEQSVAVRSGLNDLDSVTEHFVRKRFRALYRANIMRTRGRNPSNRECDLAMKEAMESGND